MQINTDNRVPQNMDHCPRGSQLFVMGLVSGSVSTHSATLAASGVKRNCVKQLCKSILVEKHNINVHFNESHQFQLSDFFRKMCQKNLFPDTSECNGESFCEGPGCEPTGEL